MQGKRLRKIRKVIYEMGIIVLAIIATLIMFPIVLISSIPKWAKNDLSFKQTFDETWNGQSVE